MQHGWRKTVEAEDEETYAAWIEKKIKNLGTPAQDQRMQACRDKRHQDKVDREVVKRIREQENATAVVFGEKPGYKPSLIYATIKGTEMPKAVESETYGSYWAKYKNKMYADSESSGMSRQNAQGDPWQRIANPQTLTSVYEAPPYVGAASVCQPPPFVFVPPSPAHHHQARGRR